MSLPTYTTDQIARQLTHDYWDGRARSFNVEPGGSLTVNLTALNSTGKTMARAALEAWENVIDVTFIETSGSADLLMNHASGGALGGHSYSYSPSTGYTITSAYVRISSNWTNTNGSEVGSYSMQTYMHEIGHALGLGHAGNYDGSATYGISNHYTNESWQMSMMSYFSQQENTSINASHAVVATLMTADIVAAQQFYGASSAQDGNTVYGAGSNVGGYLEDIFEAAFDAGTGDTDNAFTLFDSGGIDMINLRYEDADQNIDLNAEAISDIGGLIGNLIIARDTVIENLRAGNGNDVITGNGVANNIRGYGGEDVITGGNGADVIRGNGARDNLAGGNDNDILYGGGNRDQLFGNNGDDRLRGENGDDTLSGGNGNDRLLGEADDDVLNGDDGDDRLRGGDGTDILLGGAQNDNLMGEAGNDTLDGGYGDDTLTGGGGTDSFVFGRGNDRVLDFTIGQDILQLGLDLFSSPLSVQQVLDTHASSDGTNTNFEFENGSTLRLYRIDDPDSLLGSLEFF